MATAAVLASAFTLAPAVFADEVDDPTSEPTTPPPEDTPTPPVPTDEPTPTPEPTDPPTADPAEDEASEDAESEEAESSEKAQPDAAALAADFGYSKFRVGVQLADGSWVPDGTTTLGTEITITQSGPSFPDGEETVTCTTSVVDTVVETTTYCSQTFYASFEDTATITQTSVNSGLTIVDGTKVNQSDCEGEPLSSVCIANFGNILLTDSGLPPEAADDSATIDEGETATIDVLANDDTVNGAPLDDLEVVSGPSDGSVSVIGSGDARQLQYTPDDGFTGIDRFTYRITTPNGTATAEVVVQVGAVVDPPDDDDDDDDDDSGGSGSGGDDAEGVLPDTGGEDPRLLAYATALIVGGSALLARTRRRGQHVRVD